MVELGASFEEQPWRLEGGLRQKHLANIIHLTCFCRMFLTLTSHRVWTLTSSHDLEALTGDTEGRRGEEGETERGETCIDILLSAAAANNLNK